MKRRISFKTYLQRRRFTSDPLGFFVRDNPQWIAQIPDLGTRRDLETYIRVVGSSGMNWLMRDNLRRDFDVLRLLWSEYSRAGR